MSSTEEQLISFFAYSMFIYPVTAWLVSPRRSYGRWKGAIYAMIFLAAIFFVQLVYETREQGPNHYQLLGVRRFDSGSTIKKAFKRLSLELHPDKNKSPGAVERFRRVKHAYEVLSANDMRSVYDRLGDQGVKVASQSVIDHRYLFLQFIVYYASSAIFAFLMTMSGPSGDAMELSFFSLGAMLLVESLLVIEEVQLPTWFFPQSTSHDLVAFLHRLFPAFMNGSRSILGAFHVDRKAEREEMLQRVLESYKATSLRASSMIQSLLSKRIVAKDAENGTVDSEGVIAHALAGIRRLVALSADSKEVARTVEEKAALIRDPVALHRADNKDENKYRWVLYLAGYLAARFLLVKSSSSRR